MLRVEWLAMLRAPLEADVGNEDYSGSVDEDSALEEFSICHPHRNQCWDFTGHGYQIHARGSGVPRVIGWRFSDDLESLSRKEMWRFSDDLKSVPVWKDIEQMTPKEAEFEPSTISQTMTQLHGIEEVASSGPPFVGTSVYPAPRYMFQSQPAMTPRSQSSGASAPTDTIYGFS
jgi:hypothetical protein